jgi:hypothetical protein
MSWVIFELKYTPPYPAMSACVTSGNSDLIS